MDKDYISSDFVILILQEINRENWPLYTEEVFENILLACVIYDHDRFTMIIGLHTGWHRYHLHYLAFVWHHLHYFVFTTWYCHLLHCLVILIHIVFTIWHWYSWYRFLILLHWVTHYRVLHWLIKLTKPELLGETGSWKNLGGMLGRATPLWAWML